MSGTDAAQPFRVPRLPLDGDINGAFIQKDAGGSRTHWMRFCRPPPRRVTSASVFQCPRQESNLAYDLRRVACIRHTPRTNSTPPRNRTSPDCFEGSHASSTPAGHSFQRQRFNEIRTPLIDAVGSLHYLRTSRRLDLHQHASVYKTDAFLNRATSAELISYVISSRTDRLTRTGAPHPVSIHHIPPSAEPSTISAMPRPGFEPRTLR